jgi:hypothetical protein
MFIQTVSSVIMAEEVMAMGLAVDPEEEVVDSAASE